MDWLFALGLKEGLVEFATVCIKSKGHTIGAGLVPKSASPRTMFEGKRLPSASITWTKSSLSGVIGNKPSRVTPPLNSNLI